MIGVTLILRRQLHIITKTMGQIIMVITYRLIDMAFKFNVNETFKHIEIKYINPTH